MYLNSQEQYTQMMSSVNSNNYPSRMGKVWSTEEDTKLLDSVKNGKDISDISKEHERTEGGIWCRLGLIAYNMHKENRPIEEIMAITGLKEQEIIDSINKTELKQKKKLEKNINNSEFKTKLEIVNLVNDIQVKMAHLNKLIAMMN